VIGGVIQQLRRNRRNLQRALVIHLSLVVALLRIEDRTNENEGAQIRGIRFENGVELLFCFCGLALLERPRCFFDCTLRFRLLGEEQDAARKRKRDHRLAEKIPATHAEFSCLSRFGLSCAAPH
jgi:hypothetical protein